MKRITKNEFVERMSKNRVYLLMAKFEEEVDWNKVYGRCCEFDERLDQTNVEFINKNTFAWKKVAKVGSEFLTFDNGNKVGIANSECYNLLCGDYGIDYLGIRHYGCTMVYAVEKLGE